MEIILSAEELFYIGGVLQAKYIDYAYIAAMDDIQNNTELFKNETLGSLVNKGVLLEDFSGNVEIEEKTRDLLQPIFLGDFESSIDICYIDDEKRIEVIKFHILDDRITMVYSKEKNLIIKDIDSVFLNEFVRSIVPNDYDNNLKTQSFDTETIELSRIIAIKNAKIGKSSTVRIYFEYENSFYIEKENSLFYSVPEDDFVYDTLDILKGGIYGL